LFVAAPDLERTPPQVKFGQMFSATNAAGRSRSMRVVTMASGVAVLDYW